jgi:hypothetical protein
MGIVPCNQPAAGSGLARHRIRNVTVESKIVEMSLTSLARARRSDPARAPNLRIPSHSFNSSQPTSLSGNARLPTRDSIRTGQRFEPPFS